MTETSFFKRPITPWGLLTAAVFLAAAGTLGGFLGRWAWWLDLFSHFRVQYILLLGLLSICYFARQRRIMALGTLVLALINLAVVAPLYFPNHCVPMENGSPLRAMLANVNTQTGDAQALLREIRTEKPDVIVLEEINDRWMTNLQELATDYPYRLVQTREDNFGIGVLSKRPLHNTQVLYLADFDTPSLYAELSLDDRSLALVSTHPLPPGGSHYSAIRNQQLAHLAEFINDQTQPVLLLGDLNTSPWSPYFRKLLKTTGLHDASQGRGVQPSWPSFAWPFLIPLDHCLHDSEIAILNKHIGGAIGSDHYPIVVDFSWSKNPALSGI